MQGPDVEIRVHCSYRGLTPAIKCQLIDALPANKVVCRVYGGTLTVAETHVTGEAEEGD